MSADASGEFEKVKNQNRLKPENIEKIVETYKKRKDVEKYAHVASFDEIKSNDFNLNIPRYVGTLEHEDEVDLIEIQKLIDKDKQEIAELEATIAEQLVILGVSSCTMEEQSFIILYPHNGLSLPLDR